MPDTDGYLALRLGVEWLPGAYLVVEVDGSWRKARQLERRLRRISKGATWPRDKANREHPDDEKACTERYLELMRFHGHLLSPGDEGYEQGSRVLPCGYRLLSLYDPDAGRTSEGAQ